MFYHGNCGSLLVKQWQQATQAWRPALELNGLPCIVFVYFTKGWAVLLQMRDKQPMKEEHLLTCLSMTIES